MYYKIICKPNGLHRKEEFTLILFYGEIKG